MSDTNSLQKYEEPAQGAHLAMFSVDKIEDGHDADQINAVVKFVKAQIKEVKADLKTILDPLKVATSAAKTLAAKSLDPLGDAEKHGKKLLSDWDDHCDDVRRRAQAELVEASRSGAEGTELVELAQKAQTPAKPKGMSYTTMYKTEVIDASAIPREYLMVDEVALRRYAKDTKGEGVVPGVRFYTKKSARSR